jgi:AcrR family transcriptional regulator
VEAGQGGRERRRGLPRGPQALPREQVAADQRERLFAALLEVVNERGFAGTTISGLVQRAGISRRSFYEHYENKEQCLLAAFDDSVERLARRMVAGLDPDADARTQIEGLLRGLFDATVERPQAARLVCVEIAAAGPAGAERWAQGAARLEQVIARLFEQAPGEGTIPEPVAKAVVGALRKIVYARVLGARSERTLRTELNRALPGLVGWIVGYYPSPPGVPRRPRRRRGAAARVAGAVGQAGRARGSAGGATGGAPGKSATPRAGGRGGRAPGSLVSLSATGAQALPRGLPSGEHNLPRSFVEHNQRERIFDAIANLTAAHGYPAVGLEDVASQAAVSLRTFYSHFESKEEAFVATYEVGHARAVNICIEAFAAQHAWPQGVHAGVGALLEFLAAEPAYAHVACVDVEIAFPELTERVRRANAGYAGLLEFGIAQAAGPADSDAPSHIVGEAIVGGIWELLHDYVARGQAERLGELTDHATYIALTPILGSAAAAAVVAPAGR